MISLINIYWPYDSRARETSEVVIKFTQALRVNRIDGPALPPPLAAAAATSAPSPAGYCCYRRRRPRRGPALGWTTRFLLKMYFDQHEVFQEWKTMGKNMENHGLYFDNGKPWVISKIDVIFLCFFKRVVWPSYVSIIIYCMLYHELDWLVWTILSGCSLLYNLATFIMIMEPEIRPPCAIHPTVCENKVGSSTCGLWFCKN